VSDDIPLYMCIFINVYVYIQIYYNYVLQRFSFAYNSFLLIKTFFGIIGDVSRAMEETGAGDDTPFAERVRAMEDETFLSCLAMCYEHALLALTRYSTSVLHSYSLYHLSSLSISYETFFNDYHHNHYPQE
jgi:hypothetical protein